LLRSAKTEYERDQDLLKRGLIPKQTVDIQSASVDQYGGSILSDHAAMDNARAAIANAELQIVYSEITSPITGRMGLRLVDPGNIVHASDPSGLVVIAQVQPITVVFNLPEDDIGRIMKKIQAGQKLHVDAYDRDDTTKLATGTLLAVDNQIDQTTGTSRLKAIFDNKNDALFPNQFVNVHLLVEVEKSATVIPAAAIQRGPQGTYVFVVDSGRAKIRPVTVKTTQGNDVALGPELKAGEIVVIEGTDKTQDGGRVDAQMADASGHDPTPTMGADDAQGGGSGAGGGGRRRGGGDGKGDGSGGGRGGSRGGNGRGGRGQKNGSGSNQ
jgi:multidrug efflux system membrane fusion protein